MRKSILNGISIETVYARKDIQISCRGCMEGDYKC
jgi:hypothetical protein